MFDPEEPALTVWELLHSRYVERAYVTGDQTCDVTTPYRMSITPADLLG